MTIRVSPSHFSGHGKVFTREADGLAAIVRGLAIDHARIKVATANPADFTDNSTGVVAGEVVDLILPTAAFDASAAGGADQAELNGAIDDAEDAMAVVAEHLNDVRALVGLTALTYAGTVAVADTIPAMTKSVATANGASAVEFAEGMTRLAPVKNNLRVLVRAFNETMVACGIDPNADGLTGAFDNDYDLSAVADAAASADGSDSIAKTVADAFLDSLADNIASLATYWNAITWTAPALNVVAVA
jgi:hypothetical protein